MSLVRRQNADNRETASNSQTVSTPWRAKISEPVAAFCGRMVQGSFLCLVLGLLLFCSCKSSGVSSGVSKGLSKPSPNDPYAANAPKTKEEEAYYQDVYAGEWREQTDPFGFGKSIGKKSGSTTMPPHWSTCPEGAKPLSEIRREVAERRYQEEMKIAARNNAMASGAAMPGAVMPGAAMPGTGAPNGYPLNPQVPQTAMAYASPGMAPNNGGVPDGQYQTIPYYPNGQQSAPTVPQTTFQPQYQQSAYQPQYQQPAYQQNTNQYQNMNQQTAVPAQNGYPAAAPTAAVPAAISPTMTSPAVTSPAVTSPNGAPTTPFPQIQGYTSGGMSGPLSFRSSDSSDAPIIRGQMPTVTPSAVTPSAVISDKAASSVKKEPVKVAQMDIFENDPQQPGRAKLPRQNLTSRKTAAQQGPGTAQSRTASAAPSKLNPVVKDDQRRLGGTVNPITQDRNIINAWRDLRRPVQPNYFGHPMPGDDRFPHNEFIADGGDNGAEVKAQSDGAVVNLDQEDTVAQFNTMNDGTLVEPSNRVHIYSPRFGSVRQVVGFRENEQNIRLQRTELNISALQNRNLAAADVRSQEDKTNYTVARTRLSGTTARDVGNIASGEINVMEKYQETKIADLFNLSRSASLTEGDRAMLMAGRTAAQAWGELQEVAVSIESVSAQINVHLKSPEVLYQVENGTKTSKLSLIKAASKTAALPGELIEFTIRFENVGNQAIKNVTIMDNLSARLGYIPNSAKWSLERKEKEGGQKDNVTFLADHNEQGSYILRWEVQEPLQPGDFGVIQFLCKVL